MLAPMKLWELFSAFREEKRLLLTVLRRDSWRDPYLGYFEAYTQLVGEQRRDILDAAIPLALSREVTAGSGQRFFYHSGQHVVRLRAIAGDKHSILTALEIHDRFGGSVIEEVLEKGSAYVQSESNPRAAI